jgi:hypothetical protein
MATASLLGQKAVQRHGALLGTLSERINIGDFEVSFKKDSEAIAMCLCGRRLCRVKKQEKT